MSAPRAPRSVQASSWASSDAARRTMQANRGRDTGPELSIRSAVHRMGLRFRVSARPLPHLARTADLVFRPSKVAVFVDGCFWHSCPQHGSLPRTNAEFWASKLTRTVERVREIDAALKDAGWLSLRYWEHDAPDRAAASIQEAVNLRRPSSSAG